jgi:hypothetical protein
MKCTTLKFTKASSRAVTRQDLWIAAEAGPVPRLRFMSGLLHPYALDRITSSAPKEPVPWNMVGDCASQRRSPKTCKFSQGG